MSDTIYNFGDVKLDSRFWDCECKTDYIHPKTQQFCASCQTSREEQPDSRADEVVSYFPKMAVSVLNNPSREFMEGL